jgi:hypothetical protein
MRAAGLALVLLACTAVAEDNGHETVKPPKAIHKASAKPLPKVPAHVRSSSAVNPRRAANAPAPIAKGVPIRNPKTVSSPRSPSPALGSIRHHSSNPPVISGTANISPRNTGAIDGRQVHRQP